MNTKKKRKPSPKTAKEIQVQIALGTLEVEDVLKALRSKKTPGDVIEMFDKITTAKWGDEESWKIFEKQRLISIHPNTSASVLESIFNRKRFIEDSNSINYEDASILLHPNFPEKLFLEIFNKITYDEQFHSGYSHLFKVIKNPNFPTNLLESLAKHRNVLVREFVAAHPNTSPKALEYLSTDKNSSGSWGSSRRDIQEQVATNPSTPAHILKVLSVIPNISIRWRIAHNSKTPTSVLKAMMTTDRSNKVRSTALHTLFKLGKITFTDE